MAQGKTGVIKVEDFEFYIAKGWFEAEHKVENHFKVSAEVHYDCDRVPEGVFLDYVDLIGILNAHMISDIHLLEDIAGEILNDTKARWPFIRSAKVQIRKLSPAFSGIRVAAVTVEMSENWD
jgi:dihydroneopterin aldolase